MPGCLSSVLSAISQYSFEDTFNRKEKSFLRCGVCLLNLPGTVQSKLVRLREHQESPGPLWLGFSQPLLPPAWVNPGGRAAGRHSCREHHSGRGWDLKLKKEIVDIKLLIDHQTKFAKRVLSVRIFNIKSSVGNFTLVCVWNTSYCALPFSMCLLSWVTNLLPELTESS